MSKGKTRTWDDLEAEWLGNEATKEMASGIYWSIEYGGNADQEVVMLGQTMAQLVLEELLLTRESERLGAIQAWLADMRRELKAERVENGIMTTGSEQYTPHGTDTKARRYARYKAHWRGIERRQWEHLEKVASPTPYELRREKQRACHHPFLEDLARLRSDRAASGRLFVGQDEATCPDCGQHFLWPANWHNTMVGNSRGMVDEWHRRMIESAKHKGTRGMWGAWNDKGD